MKWLLSSLCLAALVGCTPQERFVSVVDKSLDKTTMVYVNTVVDAVSITFDRGQLRIKRSTETVTVRGSGVIVTPQGHMLTAAHLFFVGRSSTVTVCQYNNVCDEAELLFRDDRKDLALLKIPTKKPLPFVQVADPRDLKVGQEVVVIGNPLGFEWSVSHGVISALNRDDEDMYNMTQSDAAMNPGNSGGPVFNMDGELIGINSRIYPPINAPVFTGLGFSVSCGQVREFLTKFKGL